MKRDVNDNKMDGLGRVRESGRVTGSLFISRGVQDEGNEGKRCEGVNRAGWL